MIIQLNNLNTTPEASKILSETSEMIRTNLNTVAVKSVNECITNSKGDVIASILISLGTSIASEVIIYILKEAIRRNSDRNPIFKKIDTFFSKQNQQEEKIEIGIKDDESGLFVYIIEK